ncbi:MAG: hypothetical protein WDN30_02535 [Pararobbsia sp.]
MLVADLDAHLDSPTEDACKRAAYEKEPGEKNDASNSALFVRSHFDQGTEFRLARTCAKSWQSTQLKPD